MPRLNFSPIVIRVSLGKVGGICGRAFDTLSIGEALRTAGDIGRDAIKRAGDVGREIASWLSSFFIENREELSARLHSNIDKNDFFIICP